ncbi:MAG: acyltransferase [Bacteroidota bacterium]|jgi:peptidoglycan/LPS O-acetylase OafA/YrhL
MKVSFLLNKENNNLNLIRLFLASMVIVGHSPILNGATNYWVDPVSYFFPFAASGPWAVNIFFFISGLVVTNSLLFSRKPLRFITARFFRIMPAFAFVVLISAMIIGPIVSAIPAKQYFNSDIPYTYVTDNLLFQVYYNLPGVFLTNIYPTAVNGSLWTLAYEMSCYVILLGVFLILRNKGKIFYNTILGLIIFESFLPYRPIFNWLGSNPQINLLPAAFALGSFFAVNAEEIMIDKFSVLGVCLVYFFFRTSGYANLFFNIACSVTFLYISSTNFFNRFRPKYDISFGVYLWGFVVQQTLYHYVGKMYVGWHCLISLFITIVLAYITHLLIEKPGIELGKELNPYTEAIV